MSMYEFVSKQLRCDSLKKTTRNALLFVNWWFILIMIKPDFVQALYLSFHQIYFIFALLVTMQLFNCMLSVKWEEI